MKNKYSVILGNLGNTCDRFCKSYKDNPSTLEMLSQAVKIPHVEGIELVGTWDIGPDNVKEMKNASPITAYSAYRSSRTFSATRHTGKAR